VESRRGATRAVENAGEEVPTVASAYDRWSETYDRDANLTRDLDAAVLRAHGPAVDGRDVLELGCGTGKNTIWLAEHARSTIALDASSRMLSVARGRISSPNVRFLQHDIRAPLPIESESVDVVIIDLVLEHVEALGTVFREATRVLRAGAALFLCELHPVRQMLGGQAHFLDPVGGQVIQVPAFRHTVAEFINGGIAVGLGVEAVGEWWDEGSPQSEEEKPGVTLPRLFSATFRKS